MKKLILAGLLLFSYGQVCSQSFSAGVIGGLSSTEVFGFSATSCLRRIGVVAGGFANRSFNDRTSVQIELLYATRGSLQPGDSSNNFFFYKLRLDYIEVPLLFKYKMHLLVNSEQLDKMEVEAGPSFGILINSWQKNSYGEISFDRAFNKTDVLFNIGLNYYFSPDFSFDLRFANSIVPVRPHVNGITYLLNKGEYNMAFSYTFRYIFR